MTNEDNNLMAELLLSQAEVMRLQEQNTALTERLADAEAEARKHEGALRLSMEEEGHYRLYVRYRDQRDASQDQLAKALNQIEIEEDARILAEEKYEHLSKQVWNLYEDWKRMPVWGPNDIGLHILDDVDLEGLLKQVSAILPAKAEASG